jgi:hypothetical protein
MLAGCGGSQAPIGAPGAMPQSRAIAAHAHRGKSWMKPGAPKWDLLYVSNGNGTVTVYRYWKHDLVGTLNGFQSPEGECVDQARNVFITDAYAHKVIEYAHGGKTPIKVLEDGLNQPYDCSIDSTTGKLAVANLDGNVAIYRHAAGKPIIYSTRTIPNPLACSYDDRGDLLVTGLSLSSGSTISSFAELAKNSASFIYVNPMRSSSSEFWIYVSSVPWDGKYFAIGDDGAWRFKVKRNGQSIYKGFTNLDGVFSEGQSWIFHFSGSKSQGAQLVAASGNGFGSVVYWDYPSGGAAIATITDGIKYPVGVTVSPKQ